MKHFSSYPVLHLPCIFPALAGDLPAFRREPRDIGVSNIAEYFRARCAGSPRRGYGDRCSPHGSEAQSATFTSRREEQFPAGYPATSAARMAARRRVVVIRGGPQDGSASRTSLKSSGRRISRRRRARSRPDYQCVSSAVGAYSSNRRKRSGVAGPPCYGVDFVGMRRLRAKLRLVRSTRT